MTGVANARSPAWRGALNVLAVRLDNLGDVLMTGPALAAVKQGLPPGSRLTLLCSVSGAAVATCMPMVDDVIVYEAPWVKGVDRQSGGTDLPSPEADLRMIALLRERQFDAAIIFTVCTQSALPAAFTLRLAGIPLRAAYSRENPYALLTDVIRDTEFVGDGMRHEVERQLDLVRTLGFDAADDRLVFRVDADARESAGRKLEAHGVSAGTRYIAVHVGATAESRRYPAERFREAVAAIVLSSGCTPVFVGTASEAALVATARGSPPLGISLAGVLGLGELGALIAGADLMICNNSGPAHIAAAVGTPTVVLYALTNPQHTPWKVESRVINVDVPCRNCLKSVCPMPRHDCLGLVEPRRVVDAALALLPESPGRIGGGDGDGSTGAGSGMGSAASAFPAPAWEGFA